MKRIFTTCAVAFLTVTTCAFAAADKLPTQAVAANAEYKPKDFSHLIGMKGFSKDQLEMHFKLYEGYVKNANLLQQKLGDLSKGGQDRGPEYAGLKRMYGWEWDGMRLHELYFGSLGGDGKPDKNSEIYKALSDGFGSYDAGEKILLRLD